MIPKRFLIQPAWLDFIIFWALIVSGVAVAVILQMELVGYGQPAPIAVGVLLVTLALAGVQVSRSRLIIDDQRVTLRRLLPGNTLTLAPGALTAVRVHGHQLTLVTQPYGEVVVVRLGNPRPLVDALTATLRKERDNV
ncbi:EbsA family protein [Lacticaseibacillus daqingensis]|uniref:EbsA family protein n=1 Tax=Lacticaseibacillus daqingensis TaxID=2486014 RepID=UPI000F7B7565|nr:EbsA family protein [Lacticaseibacillus daqingensis]